MKLNIVVILLFFIHLGVSAQEVMNEPFTIYQQQENTILNHLNVQQDSRIDSLLKLQVQINERTEGTDGYRLEIYFSSGAGSRNNALQVKTDFLKQFPEETAYMTFQTPNFKVRVGDCRTKSEALKLKEKIARYYPNAFIVPDIIQYPKLYTDTKQ